MKKTAAVVLCLFCLFSLIACAGASKTYVGEVTVHEGTLYSKRYESFHGKDSFSFTIEEQRSVLVEVETVSGTLNLKLVDQKDSKAVDAYLEEDNAQTGVMEGTLEPGSYTLMVEGVNHKGGYGIQY